MADVILTSEFTSNQDIDYKVEIIDTSAGAPLANTFKVQDVILTYDPVTDAATGQVIPSLCEIFCWNEGGYFNNTFIPALIQTQQKQFQIKVYQDTGGGYSLWWFGWVIQDVMVEDEAAQPRQFKLTAVDGLSMLKDKEYDNVNTDTDNCSAIHKILINALAKNSLNTLVGASADFLVTTVDWWEDSMTYATTTDPCTLSFVDVRVWNIFSNYWERGYVDALSVITQLCVTFGARLYLADGAYRFEQYNEREGTTMREVAYRYNYTQNSATDSATREKAIGTNTSLTSARARGNQEGFLPSIKRCEITYKPLFLTKDFGQFSYTETSNAAATVGYNPSTTNAGLSVNIDYWAYAAGAMTLGRKTEMEFYIVLTLAAAGGTTYYYENVGSGRWTTSSSQYVFTTPQTKLATDGYVAFGSFNLSTKDLPADGDISLRIYLNQTQQKPFTSNTWSSVTPTTEKYTIAAQISISDGEERDGEEIWYSESTNASIGDDEILQVGETNVGDGALQTGRVWLKASGTTGAISASTNWRKGNSGTYQRLLDLCATNQQSYYHQPLQIYDGDLYYSDSFAYRVNWDGKFYLPLNASFSCNQGIWSGRWWVIDSDGSDITAQTKLIKRRDLFRRPKANVNATDIPNGRLGGVEITEGEGQISGVVDYEITPALMVTGVTGATIVPAGGADTYIVVTKVVIIKTDGTIDYGSGNASIYFASETTDVISAGGLLTAINTGLTKQFNPTDETKFFENEALLISIGSDASGDYDFTIKVYYKLITL